MRSWLASGHDVTNAIDIKEGMEYAGGIRNTKVAVAEVILGQGSLIFFFVDETELTLYLYAYLVSFDA